MKKLEDYLKEQPETLPDVPVETPITSETPGVIVTLGALPPGAIVSEHGLAAMFGKCIASIKAAVLRGEFPRPMKLMGKNVWTAGSIIRFIEDKVGRETKKFQRLSGG